MYFPQDKDTSSSKCKVPSDWGAGYSPACVTLRSLHSPTLHPQTEPNCTGSQHTSLQAPFHKNYSRTADSTFTSDLIWTCLQIHRGFYPVKLQNIQAGQHILWHRCHPIQPRGLCGCHPGGTGQQEGIPPTHSTAVRDQLPGRALRGFPLALCARQALISLHLASIAHSQAQPERKLNTSWINRQKSHLKLQNLFKDMRGPWQWCFLINQNQAIPRSYKLHSSDCCLKRQHKLF